MTPEMFAAFVAVGAVAGFFAGLLGIGGGTITTPALIIVLGGFLADEIVVHTAIASSLAAIALTTLPGAWTHARNGATDFRTGILLAAGATCGALLFSQLARYAPGALLSAALALFLLRVSYRMFYPRVVAAAGSYSRPKWLPAAGAGVGAMSSLLGVGGGVFYTPLLMSRGMTVKRAIGTSAFVNSPLAFCAAVGYVLGGRDNELLPEWTWGYVYLPAAAGIAMSGMIFSAVGARCTALLPDRILRRVFGAMMALLALRLLLKTAAGI